MTVSFKQFSTFISKTEGEMTQDQIDEAWADIFRRKKEEAGEDKDKSKVLSAKDLLKKKAEDKKKKEEDRKKELQKKRDQAWMDAKDRLEGRKKGPTTGRSERDDYALHRNMREGKQSYTEEGYWKGDAEEAGYKVKKLSGDLMRGDQTWGAFDGDKKMGEFTEKEEGRGGWLLREGLAESKVTTPGWYVCNTKEKPVSGPMTEKEAKAAAAKKDGHSAEYYSDYQIRRMSEAKDMAYAKNKQPGFFVMGDTDKVLKMDLGAAQAYLVKKIEGTEGASEENARKARSMIAKASSVKKLAIDISNFVLAHESGKNKVIR